MQIIGLCLIKNESDVIEECLRHALQFCDRIYVADNASTDDTWQIVTRLSEETNGAIVAFGVLDEPFFDGMRSRIYNAVHQELGADDWWYYLDGDEFLVEDPRQMLEVATAAGHTGVKAWIVQFQFTERDLASSQREPDWEMIPVTDRLRWYRTDWREYRFFRNQPNRAWTDLDLYLPHHEWNVAPQRPLVRHYQHRSPSQMQQRVQLRAGQFAHVESAQWRDYISPVHRLHQAVPGEALKVDAMKFYVHRLKAEIPKLGRYVHTKISRQLAKRRR